MGIAERRHHEQRIKAKYYRTAKRDELRTPSSAGLFANHGKNCSCHMCGNPRRHFGERTIQEIKAGWPEGARRILEREYTR